MSRPPCAMLAAVLLAATPATAGEPDGAAVGDELTLAPVPAEDLADLAEAALPPPPTTVVRQTRYYGTVTIDHRAHLARRAPCKSCHGPGVVSKLAFTPKIAHGRCIGCHEEVAKGPTKCAGCHVQAPKPPPTDVAAADGTGSEPGSPAPPKPVAPNPANVAAALAAFDTPSKEAARGRTPLSESFHRFLDLGLAASDVAGVSVRLTTHQDFVVVTQSFERVRSAGASRTYALLGGGLSRPLYPRTSYHVVALAGFDVVDRPLVTMLPAIGARAGLDWFPPKGLFLHKVTASLTAVVDLSRKEAGREIGGTTLYGTLATGFRVP